MWRKNELRFGNLAGENQVSDRSISEEEEDIEMFRDSYQPHSTEKELISSQRRKGVCQTDDELEFSPYEVNGSSHARTASAVYTKPNEGLVYLPTMASITNSDEEIFSDDEKTNPPTLRSDRKNMDSTWSEASREVEALVCLNANSSYSSSHDVFAKERKSLKGSSKKLKPKFVFRLHSRKEDQSMVASVEHERPSFAIINSPPSDEIDAAADEDLDESTAVQQLIRHDEESEQPKNLIVPFEQADKHEFKGHSMAEFLYSFDDSISNRLQGSSELDIKKRRRNAQLVLKRNNSSLLDDRNLAEAEDDPVEAFDSGSPFLSDDDEENHQNLMLVIPGRTMADQFHEAFGTVAVIDEMPHVAFTSNGMYGKLQQVMQSEKESQTDYLKNLSTETGFKDEKVCISVKILTRSLEAKLIVCSCTLIEDEKNPHIDSNLQKVRGVARTLTIIFNPRICGDVELETGNLICIRPPWKEVQVKGKDDVIYLCSYFTQIQP